jgi:YegS/Rv2252/BmrU family lipid kinase
MSAVNVGVVVNEGKTLGSGLEELRAALADVGHADPPWYEVPKSKKAPNKIRRLVEDDGVDRVLVWGGDGTVRRAIHTVLEEGYEHVAIGVLPAGTSNLLAKNLSIPITVRGAVDVAVQGEPRPLDIGVMNEEHFAVMAGTGFDALMIREADDSELKDRLGRIGYVWAGVRHTGVSPAHAEIELDGEPWYTGDASCIMVANVGRILGGVPAFPDASPTDGRLDVGVVAARHRTDWLRVLSSAILRRTDRSPLTRVASANEISIRLDRTYPWEVDGGDRDRSDAYAVSCRPGAVRVCQPRCGS